MKNTNYLVKKLQSYWVLFFALLFCGTIQAKVNHYVGGYGHVGEWSLLPSESDYTASFGVAGGLGFLYELQAGPTYQPTRFLFDVGVGAQYGMTSFMQSSNAEVPLPNQTDLDGMTFDYIYEIEDRHDQYTNMSVQVPLMIGVQHRKFYMLVGVKATASLLTQAHTTALISTYGRYYSGDKKVFDDFRNMPEYQFFTDLPQQKSAPASPLNLNLDACLEIGGRLGVVNYAVGYDVPKRKVEYRLAGFLDYGLVDIHKQQTLESIKLPIGYNIENDKESTAPVYKTRTMVEKLEVNDIMSTNGFAASVKNLMVGLKFTILFQLPEPGQCVLCRDAYGTSINPRHGSLKYEE